MKLSRLELYGYRRFTETSLDFDAHLTAIVGPNEAGKTSILEALTLLSDRRDIERSDLNRQRTPATSAVILRATFLVDEGTRAEVSHLVGGKEVIRLTLSLRADGSRTYEVEPRPKRDLAARQAARVQLRRRSLDWIRDRIARNESPEASKEFSQNVQAVIKVLTSESEDLSSPDIQLVGDLIAKLEANVLEGEDPIPVSEFTEVLRQAQAVEQADHPHATLCDALREFIPRALLFTEEDRLLESEYSLDQLRTPSPALANLLHAAGVAPRDLVRRIEDGDVGRLVSLEEQMNLQLKELFNSWSQSTLTVRLSLAAVLGEARLRLLTPTTGDYLELNRRSAGLRSFVALVAFVNRYSRAEGARPILLVDEAEVHLHYDAQADLIGIFEAQRLATQIIYTTHSAGCLPNDIGSGVRVVVTEGDASRVENRFWNLGFGLRALMTSMGMGASVLALTPARFAVITEGPTDFIILPILFKEAEELESLPFQIVPGLSRMPLDQFPDLDLEAARVSFLVDGDEGGNQLRDQLIEAGHAEGLVISISGPKGEATLEDLLTPELIAEAINAALSDVDKPLIESTAIPETGRSQWLRERLREQQVDVWFFKRALGNAVVAPETLGRVLAPQSRDYVQKLYSQLTKALKLSKR